MARIRTIKPELWGDPSTSALSLQARLLYIGLLSMADDDGRFLASSTAINGFVFPNDELSNTKITRWLGEIASTGMIYLYRAEGVQYGCIPNWHKHQKINRYSRSRLPEPDCEVYQRSAGGGDDD